MDKLETLIACLPNAPYKTLFAVEINALRAEIVTLQSDNTRLTLELDEAGSNCSMYKQQVLTLTQRIRDYSDVTSGCPDVLVSRELLSKNFPALYKEMECRKQLAAAQAREAKLQELWEVVEKEYFARLKEQDEEAAKFEAEKDMYGWNFHKGLRGGLVEFHIYMTKIVKALALPTDDTALMERLKEEREKCAKVCDKYKRGILDLVNVQELTRDIRSMT